MTRLKLGGAAVLVGVNLAVLLVLVLVFELSFGNWFVPYVLPNKKFNVSYTFQQTAYQPSSTVTYTRDQYGLRGVHGPLSSVELVTVGASTTDQLLITDGETWQDVIHEATGMSVANAGVDGMSTQNQPEVLEEWLHQLPGFHPRYYLYYIGGIDAWIRQKVPLAEQRRHYQWGRRIRARSAILQAIAQLRARFAGSVVIAHGGGVIPDGAGPMVKVGDDVDRAAIAAYIAKMYEPNLRATLDAHRARAESVIFVSQAANPGLVAFQPDGVYVSKPEIGAWAVMLREINRATGAVCREYADRCVFIDLAQRVRFDRTDFYDQGHNTPQGARKIGLFLAEQIEAIRKSSVDDKHS